MRTATFNNNKISYPDAITMAFNRNIVQVTTTGQADVVFEMSNGGETYTDTRQTYNNKAQIDISEYMRLLIGSDGITIGTLSKEITVKTTVGENSHTFTTYAIWGAINIGDTFNASRTITFYKRELLSQYINFFSESGANIEYRVDKGTYRSMGTGEGKFNNILLNGLGITNNATIRIGGVSNVFDYTFDNTFAPQPDGVVYINIKVDDCTDGVILRWVDRQGFMQYQKFTLSSEKYKTEGIGDEIEEEATYENYGLYGVTRYQGKETERSVKACATLVDQETAHKLTSLLSAPVVRMFKDGVWVNVKIDEATNTITNEHLQDFEINIIYPKVTSQRL